MEEWTDDFEKILDAIRVNSIVLSNLKKKRYLFLKHRLSYFRLPIITLSALNSVFSVGLQAFVNQQYISVVNCLLSLICGVISSVELYLQVQNEMEQSLVLSKSFYLLSIEIQKILQLERSHRSEDAKSVLDEKFSTYTKLIENSNLNQKSIQDKLTPLPLVGIQPSPSSFELATPRDDIPTPNGSDTSV